MRHVADDLWETATDNPAPGLTTHAYLWTPAGRDTVLFYSVATDRELDELARLGGVDHQYLSHRDEAGPMLGVLHRRFGTSLHAPAAEEEQIGRHRTPDHLFTERTVDPGGIEVVPTPGHSPGSTCFVVDGAAGRYLFTGDTLFRTAAGGWAAGHLPGISDADALLASLDVLAGIQPDLVLSSAFAGDAGVGAVDSASWQRYLDEARSELQAAVP